MAVAMDLEVSWEIEQRDIERRQREQSGDENSWMDTREVEDDKISEESNEKVEERPNYPEETGQNVHQNEVPLCPSTDVEDSLMLSSINSDGENSNFTSFGDSGDHDEDSDSVIVLSSDDADGEQAISNETNELDNFSGLRDGNGTETGSKQSMLVDISEPEQSSVEDEDEYYSSNDEDSDTDYEEYEEYQEKLYYHPAYSKEVFQALEEMKKHYFFIDLRLKSNTGFIFHAHSLVLAAVSTLVHQMLQERDEKKEMFLHLGPEVTDLGLSALLEFAYTGTIRGLNKDSLAQIQTAALCLEVSRVLDLCKREKESEKTRDGGKKTEEQISAEEQLKLSLESIWQLWEKRVGCDLELKAEGRIFRAHKALLIASSEYFRAMFCSGMRESQQTSVTLRLIGAAELGILLECSYSGALALDWSNVFELTCTALQFQFQPALSLCLDFMQQEMDAVNCLDVAAFAEAYGMSDLQHTAEDFVVRHFEDVAATLKFQDLPAEKLKAFLCSNALCVSSELPVFKAVMSWIGANPRRRMRDAKELMATVHFPLMTFKEFREVKAIASWPKVSTEDLYDSLVEEFCSSASDVHSSFRTYLPKEALVLVGGERITENLDKRVPCQDIWFSNSFRNHVGVMKRVEWRMLGELPEKPRFSHKVGAIKGKLYVVGGRHYYGKTDTMKCAYSYDTMQNSWQRLADMHERRGSFALVVLNEQMYAIGGNRDSEVSVESVEVYCFNKDSWSFAHPLDQSLSSHAASVWNGQIFISGGFDCTYHCLVSMLLYHPEKGTTYLADMSQSRAQHCMELFRDHLYVAGGVTDAGGQLVDQLACESYNPVTDLWGAIRPLSVPHVSAASAVLEGKIYILGGYCQEDYSDTKRVHRYDPAMQGWENMCGTPGPTTYIAACVLPIPFHLRQ